jgi:SM-20-related protein
MTSKQILDSFSEMLMQDERILSARERALLLNILQQANAASHASSETHAAVVAVIASAVGESVAQRAFGLLGGSIVERILQSAPLSILERERKDLPTIYADNPSTPPSPQPQPPQVKRPPMPPVHPQPPYRPAKDDPPSPAPAPDPHPQPPHDLLPERRATAVLDRPAVMRAQCVILDEFLAPQELKELTGFTLAREIDFSASEVVSPSGGEGRIDYEHRRSRVLVDLGAHENMIVQRIKSVLPRVLEKLGMEKFPVKSVEVQITASRDGDFFRCHSDNGDRKVASRHLTFVYFFHREPLGFEGGELMIHDSRLEGERYVKSGAHKIIVPQQNQIIFFPCELVHEITPVKCSSGLFADSRFTLNGWLHR